MTFFGRIPDIRGNKFELAIIGSWDRWHGLIGDCAMRETNLAERNAFSEWTITADDANRRIGRAIRICVGNHIRQMYAECLNEPIPPKLVHLLLRLDSKTTLGPSPRGAAKVAHYLAEAEFCAELAETIKRPDYKDRWLKIAQEWRDLANQARTGGKATQHRH